MKSAETFILALLIAAFYLSASSTEVFAETLPEPVYKTAWPKFAEITEEAVYQYRVMEYKGRVKLDLVKNESDAKYDTPEDALISLFSAIYAGDYDWWLSSWTKESQKELKEDYSSKDDLLEEWKSFYKDNYIALISRIETGKYVLLYYNVASKRNKIKQRRTIAFVKEDDRWLATNELSDDPVFLYWQNSNYKAFKVGRELILE